MQGVPEGFRICDAKGCVHGKIMEDNPEGWDYCQRCHGAGEIVDPIYGRKDPLVWLAEAISFVQEDVTVPDHVFENLDNTRSMIEDVYINRLVSQAEDRAEGR